MFAGHDILEIRPPEGVHCFFERKPPKLWCVGDPAILKGRLLGIISARRIDPDLALKASQLITQLASLEDVSFISGWHSPLEEEALRMLLVQPARVIFCLPKSLDKFVPSEDVKDRVRQGRALLLTHCSPRAKRISRDASLRRNHLVVGLARALLVLSAPEGSASLKLARTAINRGKTVLATEHRINGRLLASDALPATLQNIQTALQ